MKVGDLVTVTQTIGCHTPPRLKQRGVGVVLGIANCEPIQHPRLGLLDMGRNIKVGLATGEIEIFHEESVKVI